MYRTTSEQFLMTHSPPQRWHPELPAMLDLDCWKGRALAMGNDAAPGANADMNKENIDSSDAMRVSNTEACILSAICTAAVRSSCLMAGALLLVPRQAGASR
jgi:hypothetical protein